MTETREKLPSEKNYTIFGNKNVIKIVVIVTWIERRISEKARER